jgi:hypothetical protein
MFFKLIFYQFSTSDVGKLILFVVVTLIPMIHCTLTSGIADPHGEVATGVNNLPSLSVTNAQ